MPRPSTTPPDQLIGAAQLAKILHVHRNTITRAARDGQLPYVQKLPGHTGAYLFRLADVADANLDDGTAA